MTPAENIIRKCAEHAKCNGYDLVAELAGVHVSRVYRWTYPADRGGTDGRIPSKHQRPILDGAKARNIPIGPEDFFDAPGQPDDALAREAAR